ncbi:alpha-L-rhamnosidase C-terminal domain-containing protein [Paenibacillus sp. BC26]|uniref:alpha-L-rhamnosidase-related protein n=1 Tax=Paenibacillus sp. BC26 TaxID=1881032 RepID=UPI0008E48142|nr:alpha-L-rhamnosidase C-terminal domain-containing protein [Paenibacillus sp. BC26]SFS55285.1 Alpha-L-rhamnosidase N-terminal domain-containing protein [Paenibacillus sp. BC26]
MEENLNWQAKWIWPNRNGLEQAAGEREPQLAYFRRSFHVSDKSDVRLTVRVSADSRYRLWLNGESLVSGPLKGDMNTHYYEVIDVTDKLLEGENVWAAQVIYYAGRTGPASVWRSDMGAFLLDGQLADGAGNVLEDVSTDTRWQAMRLGAGAFTFERETFTLFIGGGERVKGSDLPIGFTNVDYDDSKWTNAVVVSEIMDGMYGQLTRWQLTERSIPFMRETARSFTRVMQASCGERTWSEGVSPEQLFGVVLAPGEKLIVELDASRMTSGYPRVQFYGGRGAQASVLYAESYELPPEGDGTRHKGVRDDKEGKSLYGFEDYYSLAGVGDSSTAESEAYEPIHRRGFRFIRLTLQAADEPVTLAGIDYRQSGYPLEELAAFDGSDPTFAPLWEISLNTLRGCMHETYEDTPFYEQMQYELDSRLQALFTYSVSGDDKLGRKTIRDFHSSLLPSGILQSRYPSVDRQVIPGFALFWLMMVYDHYKHYGDASLVKAYRPTMDAVLGWFENRREESGLVGQMPTAYWSFVDWTMAWKDNAGAPHAARRGPLTVYNLMYADALVKAAEMNEWTGRNETGAEYRERAASVLEAVRLHCWSESRQLFRDGPAVEAYSQHAQVWAVLTGTVKGNEAKSLTARMLDGDGDGADLAQISTAMSYYLFRALAMTGKYEQTFELWDSWRRQVDLHLTAWVEDPVSERSDCHAWGALPLYEFPAEILGIKPLAPGFAQIGIAPVVGPLNWAKGSASTPHGLVEVGWQLEGSRFTIQVNGPAGIPVTLTLPSGEQRSFAEARELDIECDYTGNAVTNSQ